MSGSAPPQAAQSAPLAVLFACGLNSVRSPIAAGLFSQAFGRTIYVGSAGVRKGDLDPFAVAAMEEIGIDISKHKPITFEELEEWEGLNFERITVPSNSPAPAPSMSNTGRRRIPPARKEAARKSSTAIAHCVTNCWGGSASALPGQAWRMSRAGHFIPA
jgi:Low molecular weight phosphotyrosine protein phosphatase